MTSWDFSGRRTSISSFCIRDITDAPYCLKLRIPLLDAFNVWWVSVMPSVKVTGLLLVNVL